LLSFSGYLLLPIVGRAKQCLDFTLTLYFLHFLLCTLYEGALPSTWAWWCVNLLACVLSVVLGEYLCLQKELEAIPMTSDEREARERRAAKQNQLNEATKAERQSMLEEEKGVRGDRGVTTTTIRLAPTNVFNV
jgi:hypothetical protein